MTFVFNPSGGLNVSRDASELPDDGLRRAKNVRTDQAGIASTRPGTLKLNDTAIETKIFWLEISGGTRYAFTQDNIYEDETSIASSLTEAQWSAIKYNSADDTTENIFATNGTDKKRIESGTVYEWGIAAPTEKPVLSTGQGSGLTGKFNAKYTYVRRVGDVTVAESDPSPAADLPIQLTDQSLSVSITQPTDSQVTHIALYRTGPNGSEFFADSLVPVNSAYDYGYTFPWEESLEHISGQGFKFTFVDSTNSTHNTTSWEIVHKDQDVEDQDFGWDDDTYYYDGVLGEWRNYVEEYN